MVCTIYRAAEGSKGWVSARMGPAHDREVDTAEQEHHTMGCIQNSLASRPKHGVVQDALLQKQFPSCFDEEQ